jgi:hypothetical protein
VAASDTVPETVIWAKSDSGRRKVETRVKHLKNSTVLLDIINVLFLPEPFIGLSKLYLIHFLVLINIKKFSLKYI